MKIVFTQEELNSFVKHHLDLDGKTVDVEIAPLKVETVPSDSSWIPYYGIGSKIKSVPGVDGDTRVEVLLHNGCCLIGKIWKLSWDDVKAYRFL